MCAFLRQVRPWSAGWLNHSICMKALQGINELHLDADLASGLPLFLFPSCCHFVAHSMMSVNSGCKYPVFLPSLSFFPLSVVKSPVSSPSLSLFFFFSSGCGALELSDKYSGLNNRSCRSNVSSKFICQWRGQIKAMHFLHLPRYTPRGEQPLLKTLTAHLHCGWITHRAHSVICALVYH